MYGVHTPTHPHHSCKTVVVICRGVQWLLAADVRDLSLYQSGLTTRDPHLAHSNSFNLSSSSSSNAPGPPGASGIMDVDWLAYLLFLSEQGGVNMSCQVVLKEGLSAARPHGRSVD
jgi:hypothetical protein